MMRDDLVFLDTEGALGVVTLNRPERINAINPPMVYAIAEALESYAADDEIRSVLIEGTGDRGLCAGGDLQVGADGVPIDPVTFLRRHYGMNALLSNFPKPVVSFMDGIVMGGGVGLSAHGRYRVVTERSRVSMPETRIGMCPDVGGTHLLSRSPGLLGLHLGMGALDMDAADAIYCGFADSFVPSAALPAMRDDLVAHPGRVHEVIWRHAVTPPVSALAEARRWVDACFAEDSVVGVLARLDAEGIRNEAAAAAAVRIREMSPTAVTAFFYAYQLAESHSFIEDSLNVEYRAMLGMSAFPDQREGIRARILAREEPVWSPARFEDVDVERIIQMLREDSFTPPFPGRPSGSLLAETLVSGIS